MAPHDENVTELLKQWRSGDHDAADRIIAATYQELRRLARGEDPRTVLDYLSHGLAAKLLHAPTHALSHAAEEDREALAQLVARLYQVARPEGS